MYFPVAQVDYAQPGYKYDIIEIQYKHDHPSSTGIARAGEINTLKIFVGTSSTALAALGTIGTALGIAAGVDEQQIADFVLQTS